MVWIKILQASEWCVAAVAEPKPAGAKVRRDKFLLLKPLLQLLKLLTKEIYAESQNRSQRDSESPEAPQHWHFLIRNSEVRQFIMSKSWKRHGTKYKKLLFIDYTALWTSFCGLACVQQQQDQVRLHWWRSGGQDIPHHLLHDQRLSQRVCAHRHGHLPCCGPCGWSTSHARALRHPGTGQTSFPYVYYGWRVRLCVL